MDEAPVHRHGTCAFDGGFRRPPLVLVALDQSAKKKRHVCDLLSGGVLFDHTHAAAGRAGEQSNLAFGVWLEAKTFLAARPTYLCFRLSDLVGSSSFQSITLADAELGCVPRPLPWTRSALGSVPVGLCVSLPDDLGARCGITGQRLF